jgi:hypothetical protein
MIIVPALLFGCASGCSRCVSIVATIVTAMPVYIRQQYSQPSSANTVTITIVKL